jgi:hypothetical protein
MSNKINDGGPAFPADFQLYSTGMTLRDYFAAAALPAAYSAFDSKYFGNNAADYAVATAAYQMADAMLKAREAKP